jgi:hypothetical protein
LAVDDFDAERSLAYKALDYRKNKAVLASFYERRNDMLVPEELSRSQYLDLKYTFVCD